MEIEYQNSYEIIKCDEINNFCTIADQLQQRLALHFQENHFGKKNLKFIEFKLILIAFRCGI